MLPRPYNFASPRPSRETRTKPRYLALLSNIPVIGRSTLLSHIQQQALDVYGGKFPSLIKFNRHFIYLQNKCAPSLAILSRRAFFESNFFTGTLPAQKSTPRMIRGRGLAVHFIRHVRPLAAGSRCQ